MSAVPRPAGPTPVSADDAVRQYVSRVRREIEPDPLFRRRLRGTVVNRFVADREGTAAAPVPRSSRMGRLGRACLYASVATALTVGGVMAASESALPGDLLYPLKRSIEALRMEVAPAELQDELAAYALAERIDELARLVDAGATGPVADLAASITATYEGLLASGHGAALAEDRLAAQLARLEAVLDRAPVRARRAIERAMSGAPGLLTHAAGGPGRSDGESAPAPSGQGAGPPSGGAVGPDEVPAADAPGQVHRMPEKEIPPQPDRTPRPERSPRPSPHASPEQP